MIDLTPVVAWVLALLSPPAPAVTSPAPVKPTVAPETTQKTQEPRSVPLPAEAPQGTVRTVSSTAYCLTGHMANGQRAHSGAVAMNRVAFGTSVEVMSGPLAGSTLVVKDRIGHGSQFDVAMPADCSGARQYGRRLIQVRY
jgi:hypothetical protein